MTAGQIEYRNYLKSWRWQLISSLRKWRDGKCRVCHEKRGLQAHHASYKFKNRYNWLLIVPALTIAIYTQQPFGIVWVIASVAIGVYGLFREWNDCITLCAFHHKTAHDGMNIREFAD